MCRSKKFAQTDAKCTQSVFPNVRTCKCAGYGFVHCGIFHISAVHSICPTAHHPYTKSVEEQGVLKMRD